MSIQKINFTSTLAVKNQTTERSQENIENQPLDKTEPVLEKKSYTVRNTVAVFAGLALVALGVYKGRQGKLGLRVQKFLGGAEKAVEHKNLKDEKVGNVADNVNSIEAASAKKPPTRKDKNVGPAEPSTALEEAATTDTKMINNVLLYKKSSTPPTMEELKAMGFDLKQFKLKDNPYSEFCTNISDKKYIVYYDKEGNLEKVCTFKCGIISNFDHEYDYISIKDGKIICYNDSLEGVKYWYNPDGTYSHATEIEY